MGNNDDREIRRLLAQSRETVRESSELSRRISDLQAAALDALRESQEAARRAAELWKDAERFHQQTSETAARRAEARLARPPYYAAENAIFPEGPNELSPVGPLDRDRRARPDPTRPTWAPRSAAELSLEDLVGVGAALQAARGFERPAAVIAQDGFARSVAVASNVRDAHRFAREADPEIARGGSVGINREVDATIAAAIVEASPDCVVAPAFSTRALAVLRCHEIRLLTAGPLIATADRRLSLLPGGQHELERACVVTRIQPTAQQFMALAFSWRVCRHLAFNATVIGREDRTVAVGARARSCAESIGSACERAGTRAEGSVLAVDRRLIAPHVLELLACQGVVAVAQPGGSVHDPELIAAADDLGLAMLFTAA